MIVGPTCRSELQLRLKSGAAMAKGCPGLGMAVMVGGAPFRVTEVDNASIDSRSRYDQAQALQNRHLTGAKYPLQCKDMQ